ncbi:MAG TPA: DUF4974 domain-containing protein [Candidatus Angelobacter sp.]|nr:DUF4974 domain-containing protein [Candidatus Angelobacter sp.]
MANRSASGWILTGVGACVVLFASTIWFGRSQSRRSLEAWKARMIARGEKFGIDELAPPPSTTSDTNLDRIISAFSALERSSFNPGVYSALDFAAAGEARAPWSQTNLTATYGQKTTSWTQLTEEMDSVRENLDEIRSALEHPADTSIFNYHNFSPPNFVAQRVVAQWLKCETIERLHAGDLAGAQAALRPLTALTRLHQNDLLVANLMIRVTIGGLDFEASWSALQMPGWTEPRLAELQSDWGRLKFLEKLSPTIEMERAHALEQFDYSLTNGLQRARARSRMVFSATTSKSGIRTFFEEHFLDPFWRIAWAEQDELFYLESMQRHLDAIRNAQRHKSWAKFSGELFPINSQINERMNGLGAFRHTLSGQFTIASFVRAYEYVMRQETQRSLMIAAVALKRYQLHFGKLPPHLESLTPEFLATVPVDYMNGQSLHYRLEPDGLFVLYSVGLDGKDDGGDPQPAVAWKPYTGLWDGRDAVWPRLATAAAGETAPAAEILQLVKFDDAPLLDVIRTLARQANLQVQIDPKVLKQSFAPVRTYLENVTAEDVLKAILANNNLVLVKHPGTNIVGITWK